MSLMSSHLHRQLPFWLFWGFQKTAVSDKSIAFLRKWLRLQVWTSSLCRPWRSTFCRPESGTFVGSFPIRKAPTGREGPWSSWPLGHPSRAEIHNTCLKICVFVIIWVIAVITGSYGFYDVSCPCLCYFDCFKMQVRVSRRPKLANCVGGSWGSATHNGLHECIRLHALLFCARWYVS